LLKAWQSGAISHETFIDNMRRGEVVASDRSYEQEKDAIESEGGDINIIPVMQTQDV
jgi:hypothetical protein